MRRIAYRYVEHMC